MKNNDNSKHTPGPWHRNIRANGLYPIVFSGRNNHVAQVLQQQTSSETEANIDLIASAPDLLNALKQLVHLHMCEQEGIQSGMPTAKQWLKAVDEAATVIAKAEGKEVSND